MFMDLEISTRMKEILRSINFVPIPILWPWFYVHFLRSKIHKEYKAILGVGFPLHEPYILYSLYGWVPLF